MDINHFIGPDGKPDVGCIIWDAEQTAELLPQRYEVLREAINNYGISVDRETVIKNVDLFEQLKINIPAGVGTHSIQIG